MLKRKTCADCLHHKCDCWCKKGEKFCNGFCTLKRKKRNCNTKKCPQFVLDIFFKIV